MPKLLPRSLPHQGPLLHLFGFQKEKMETHGILVQSRQRYLKKKKTTKNFIQQFLTQNTGGEIL